jgi:hypothetical protein
MVQFHDLEGRSPGPKDYWKLDTGNDLTIHGLRAALAERNFTILTSGNNTRRRALYARAQRGLMSYEGMPTRELRRYATQRGVKIIYVPKATRITIKAQLEQADEDATFDRFAELPPELRKIIFQHHFDSFPTTEKPKNRTQEQKWKNKTQPPITQVSRLIRSEALPLFYNSYAVQLVSVGHNVHAPYQFERSPATDRFLQNMDAQNLGRVKSIQVDFDNLNTRVTIDLNNRVEPVSLADVYYTGPLDPAEAVQFKTRRQQLLSALRILALSIAARPGPSRFVEKDMEVMGEEVRSILDVAATQ